MRKRLLLLLSLTLQPGLAVTPASAAFIATMQPSGPDVLITGSGTLDLTALSLQGTGASVPVLFPSRPLIALGGPGSVPTQQYGGSITGPGAFGTGGFLVGTVGTGPRVGLDFGSPTHLRVPTGYVSGSPLSATSTYLGSTFASLGVTPSTYVWSWGSGGNADSFTLNIIPEPSTALLLASGLVAMAMGRRRRAL